MPEFRDPEFLLAHIRRTMSFYDGRCLDPSGGFFHFYKDDGTVYDRRTRHLVSSTRFVFNHAMAYRRFGGPSTWPRYVMACTSCSSAHARPQGGYAWQIDWHDGRATVQDATNHCYGLAFVLLAHAHALMAGVVEAAQGLEATWQLMKSTSGNRPTGCTPTRRQPDWKLAPYRGQNANMHACEAMMAAFDATRDAKYLQRARRWPSPSRSARPLWPTA